MSKTILIGREVDGTHLVALTLDAKGGKPTKTYIGDNVSTSVTRLRLVDNNRWVGHCKIDIEDNGSMRISNMKAENITSVNGNGVASRAITWNDNITLGSGKYQLDMAVVKKIIDGLTPPPPPEAKSIKHLEHVWKKYDEDRHNLQKENRRLQKLSRMSSVFTLPSMALSAIFGVLGLQAFTIVTILMTCTGAIVMVYSFYKSNRFDIVSENEKLTERLKQNYCCPHCSLPLTGMGEYATLSKKINISKKCPHCGKPLKTE